MRVRKGEGGGGCKSSDTTIVARKLARGHAGPGGVKETEKRERDSRSRGGTSQERFDQVRETRARES